jgi:phosphoribosyl 1,2-cyclic phosphodiesterase
MQTFSLQSGSSGNAIFVDTGRVRLLFDAGVNARRAQERMSRYGRNLREVDAILVSHDHDDHISAAGSINRLFFTPLYMTAPTYRSCRHKLGKLFDLRHFRAGDSLIFGDAIVHTIRTPHDAVDGVAFVVEHDGKRLGILIDVGHAFAELRALVATLDAAYIESNYDPGMLAAGSYPQDIKERIAGQRGHLSNADAAELIACGPRLRWAALAHISENNNHPDVALATARRTLGADYPLHIAGRHTVSPLLEV